MSDFPKLPRIKQDDENMEKIHCAARRGQTELVRRLIAVGIDPNIQNRFGCTALHLACKHGQLSVAHELAPRSLDLSHAWHGHKPLHLAAAGGYVDIINVLVEAAKAAQKPVDQFINELDDYETQEVLGRPKTIAGQTALHIAVSSRNLPLVRHLLTLGANPSAKDKNGDTCIIRCVQFGLVEEFELLVQQPGVRLDAADRLGRSALHHALLLRQIPLAKRLVELGAETHLEDQNKESPMLLMALTGVPALLEPILSHYDSFAFLQLPLHNQINVLPERFHFKDFVEDPVKLVVLKLFQKKLDALAKERDAQRTGTTDGRGAGGKAPTKPSVAALNSSSGGAANVNMTLAPSAPIKKA